MPVFIVNCLLHKVYLVCYYIVLTLNKTYNYSTIIVKEFNNIRPVFLK